VVIEPPECINLHPDKQDFKNTLSPTSLSQLLDCEEKWRLSRVERLEPAVKSVPLEMGAAFAVATEHGDPALGCRIYFAAWEEAHEKHDTDLWTAAPSQERAEINAAIVEAGARAYLARYGQVQLREQTYRVPIRGGAHDLLCRVDGVENDGRTLVEDKFVSRVDRGTIDRRLKLDRQVSIEFYTHWRVTGILAERMRYRMTLKCGLRRGRRESHDEFLDRIAKDYEERPDFYLAEFEATRTLEDFERLEQELAAWSMRLVFLRASNAWTRNTARCSDYRGCEFLPLCSGEPGARHQYVKRGHSRVPGVTEEEAAMRVAAASARLKETSAA
jgi:hypothetical protein